MMIRDERFSERARSALSLAQKEAQRLNHSYIGTEHLLLGLVREAGGVAARALVNLGVELNEVRTAVEFIIGKGDQSVSSENIGFTPRVKNVIELAVDEARRLNHHYIGTEHLLIGMMREGEGVAAEVLKDLGVTLDKVRAETVRILSGSVSPQVLDLGVRHIVEIVSGHAGSVVVRALQQHAADGLTLAELQVKAQDPMGATLAIRPNAIQEILPPLESLLLIRKTQEHGEEARYRLTELGANVLGVLDEARKKIESMLV